MNTPTYLGLVIAACVGAGPSLLPAAEGKQVYVKVDGKQADFLIGKELAGRYEFGPEVAKPYLWPVNDVHGNGVTRDWPLVKTGAPGSTDHVHQKSMWFGHGDVIVEGIEPKQKIKGVEGFDFWSEAKGHGQIVCTSVDTPQQHDEGVALRTKNEWRTPEGQKLLDETRVISFYDLGDARLFVFAMDLAATTAPITFGDTKEGTFAVRINDQLRESGGQGHIQNANGKSGEKNCWGQLSSWCDDSGSLASQPTGLAIFDDPKNPYPASWHVRGYGLMAANPFGRVRSGFPAMKGRTDRVHLSKGEHLRFRYGLLIHSGNAQDGKVQDYFDRFLKLTGR